MNQLKRKMEVIGPWVAEPKNQTAGTVGSGQSAPAGTWSLSTSLVHPFPCLGLAASLYRTASMATNSSQALRLTSLHTVRELSFSARSKPKVSEKGPGPFEEVMPF